MRRLLLLCTFLLVAIAAQAETVFQGMSAGSSLSIGPSGLSLQNPGMSQPAKVSFDGKGSASMTFSLTGNPVNRAPSAPSAPVRILPPAASSPSSLTDSDAFFKNVGK